MSRSLTARLPFWTSASLCCLYRRVKCKAPGLYTGCAPPQVGLSGCDGRFHFLDCNTHVHQRVLRGTRSPTPQRWRTAPGHTLPRWRTAPCYTQRASKGAPQCAVTHPHSVHKGKVPSQAGGYVPERWLQRHLLQLHVLGHLRMAREREPCTRARALAQARAVRKVADSSSRRASMSSATASTSTMCCARWGACEVGSGASVETQTAAHRV